MTINRVQCKGSGRKANVGFNAKRAICPVCHRPQDVASNGNIRKHMRLMRTKQMKGVR